MLLPEVMQSLLNLGAASKKDYGVPSKTLSMIHLRASQINGCSVCVDMHARELVKEGETNERLIAVAAWRDAPYFTDAERAVLALTEAVTRIADSSDPVPDQVWDEAARHYGEKELAVLTLHIAMINLWNRLNVPTRQVAGEWLKSAAAAKQQQEQAREPALTH
jgi:AhpD family alkylhydroperoxidase